MTVSRRALLTTAAGVALAPIPKCHEALAQTITAELEDYIEGPPATPGAPVAPAACPDLPATVRTTAEGNKFRLYANGSDQWPMMPWGTADTYIGAGGDGWGFLRESGEDKDAFIVSKVKFVKSGSNFEVEAVGGCDPDLFQTPEYIDRDDRDDYKPNALIFDQRNDEYHCFIARGDTPNHRQRAWLISSSNGTSWNTGALPKPLSESNPRAVFDANLGGNYTPVGVCNRPEGSVHPQRLHLPLLQQAGQREERRSVP